MEPRIQYAKTTDGVSIAYWALGNGEPPLVEMPAPPWSHVQMELEVPSWRSWDERLARNHTHVRFDTRGTGLSERNLADLSFDHFLLDLEAVVDRLGLDTFALFGHHLTAQVAITYAANHPDRVSHLILWCGFARPEYLFGGRTGALRSLIEDDWEAYTETFAHLACGWSEGGEARRLAAVLRECVTPQMAQSLWDLGEQVDVTGLLPDVRAPTLVMQRREYAIVSLDAARELASNIPNAQLCLLEGSSGATYVGNMEAVAQAIDDFLGKGEEAEPKVELPEGMAVILFADIVDSTVLTEQLGDAAFRAKARELDTSLRSVIKDSGGTPVEGKVLGDGVLAVFTSARQAIDCALHCNRAGEPLGLQLHLGIHAGDVIREGNNVYGGAVNVAARIAAVSAPGEVLVSDTVRGLARTSAGVSFGDRGEHELKGIQEPQRLFAVRGGADD